MPRGSEPIRLEKDAVVSLTCSQDQRASSKLLPISCPAFDWFDLRPGAPVFIGQYLFTGGLCTTLGTCATGLCPAPMLWFLAF